jgi:hypothetical protein
LILLADLPCYYVFGLMEELARCMIFFGCGLPLIATSCRSIAGTVVSFTVCTTFYVVHLTRCIQLTSFDTLLIPLIILVACFNIFVWRAG